MKCKDFIGFFNFYPCKDKKKKEDICILINDSQNSSIIKKVSTAQLKNLAHYTGIAGIITLSFFCYSSNFFPLLGSDDAIQVLMIHDFKLPHDLYFWGQDRYGSLIPLLGQLFYRGFGISPLTSESVTHFLILIAGYFAFAGLFKSKSSRFILAVLWFFPPIRMIDLLRLNIGLEYSLLAIGIFMINKLYGNDFEKYRLKQHVFLLSVVILFILSTWVSDLAAVSIILILALQVYFGDFRKSIHQRFLTFWKPEVYYFLGGAIIGAAFIFYGKYYADKSPLYANFNNLKTVFASIRIFGGSLLELLLFKASEPFTSAYLYLVILCAASLFIMRGHIRLTQEVKKWILFFVLDFILLFGVIMLSRWSYMNGVPRRYFICCYISFWMTFLLAFDNMEASDIKKAMRVVLIIGVVMAGVGSLYNLKYIWPKTLKPKVEFVREFESLGRIGIIGNYWNSYINSITNPDQIISTPDDRSSIRNRAMANKVMKRDTIYIIKDGWMESFPDSLNQFGIQLYKNGNEFRMGDCFICRYRK